MIYRIDDKKLVESFKEHFNQEPIHFSHCGGRFEVCGNHVDHNHGVCVVATCNLMIKAAVALREDNEVHVVSHGYDNEMIIRLDHLELGPREKGTSPAIIKGVLYYLIQNGYKVNGFNAYVDSEIPAGSGLSSSAAYETLFGRIVSELFNDNSIDKLVIAKAGYFSENNYFGKKSGLLDQIGVAYGGMNLIDFKDIENPLVAKFEFPFKDVRFVLINTGGSHADLGDLYSSIPESMYKVAEHFGQKYLRDIPEDVFFEEVKEEKAHGHDYFEYIDRKRATHFYEENKRVINLLKAIKEKDEDAFFDAINGSSKSSQLNLENTMVPEQYAGSPQEAIDYANAFIEKGAIKINGGGFMGTVIAFIREEELDQFLTKMRARYGEDMVYELGLLDE